MTDDPVFVMRHGHPVMVLLSVGQFEGILETIEILSDLTFAKGLRNKLERARAGEAVSFDESQIQLER